MIITTGLTVNIASGKLIAVATDWHAEVAKLADAGDLKSPGLTLRAGSSPAFGTMYLSLI